MMPPMWHLYALPVVAILIIRGGPAASADTALRVTTDSAEYCDTLAHRLAGMPSGGAPMPLALGEEGRRLCAGGHYRTGIAKLRRAIRLAAEARAGG